MTQCNIPATYESKKTFRYTHTHTHTHTHSLTPVKELGMFI